MCNPYGMKGRDEEIANLFRAEVTPGVDFGGEVYPGYPGLVAAEGAARPMTWGFPLRLKTMKPTSKPKVVNNARDDKLMTPMWRTSFEKRLRLIPVSQWAEAEGATGRMTRTWYSLHGIYPFAVAGIWRCCEEWGRRLAAAFPLRPFHLSLRKRQAGGVCGLTGYAEEMDVVRQSLADEEYAVL